MSDLMLIGHIVAWEKSGSTDVADLAMSIRDAQAEISFKAGIREVVGWIRDNNELNDEPFEDAYGYEPLNTKEDMLLKAEKLEAKLKNWGIE